MRRKQLAFTIIPVALVMVQVASDGFAASLAIPVAADTYIRNDGAGPNSKNDDDPDNELIVGTNAGVDDRLNGLLRFDVSGLKSGLGPGDSLQINSVELQMQTRSGAGGAGSTLTLDLREYGFEFVEADATYNDPDGDGNAGTGDTTPGGTFGTLLSTTTFNPSPQNNPVTFGSSPEFISALLDALATDDTLNLLLAENSPDSTQQFARFNDEDRDPPPTLAVDFDVVAAVPEPSSIALWTLLGLMGIGFGWRQWRGRTS